MARPTKYTKALLEKAEDYLNTYETTYEHAIPSIAGLAVALDVRRETLHVWAKEEGKEAFSNILGKLLEKQEQVLISKGLKNEFNSNIVKLALGKHGYSDKTQQDNISSDGSMSPPDRIELIAKDISSD